MLFSSKLAAPEASQDSAVEPQADKPYDFDCEIPEAVEAAGPKVENEFVMGSRQLASIAFVGILILGLMSAIAYFAGRRNTEAAAPKVTERVIERVVQVPAPAPVPGPAKAPSVAAAKTVEQAKAPGPVPVQSKAKAEMIVPTLNRLYLQAGSVEVGIAEVMVEGLRSRGIPAIVGTGINSKVARVLVGPFNSAEEQNVLQKKVEAMGFHPYPRSFTAKDLEQQQVTLTETPTPPKP